MKVKAVSSLLALLFLLAMSVRGNGQIAPFVEPDDGRDPLLNGRAPLIGGINQASKSIDMYIFRLCADDGTCDPILNSIVAAAAPPRLVAVRVVLEPCPGLGPNACQKSPHFGASEGARTACENLSRGGVQVKWANPGDANLPIAKTHAKSILIDRDDVASKKALIMTLNLLPVHFSQRRDYGVLTNAANVIGNLSRVFTHDWGTDAPLTPADCRAQPRTERTGAGQRDVQPDDPLIISPDVMDPVTLRTFARDSIVKLIQSASTSLKVQVQRVDDPEIVDELVAAIGRGVELQVLLDPSEPTNADTATLLNTEPPEKDRALSQSCISAPGGPVPGRPHAKMMIVDGRQVFVGSHNMATTSLDERREISRVTDDADTIRRFNDAFDADWAITVSTPPACL